MNAIVDDVSTGIFPEHASDRDGKDQAVDLVILEDSPKVLFKSGSSPVISVTSFRRLWKSRESISQRYLYVSILSLSEIAGQIAPSAADSDDGYLDRIAGRDVPLQNRSPSRKPIVIGPAWYWKR